MNSLPSHSCPTLIGRRLLQEFFLPTSDFTFLDSVDLDTCDEPTIRLITACYPKVAKHYPSCRWSRRLLGNARHVWSFHKLQEHTTQRLLETLEGAAIPVIVVQGAEVSRWLYPTRGLTHEDDSEILVPESLAALAITRAEQLGWQRRNRFHPRDPSSQDGCFLQGPRGRAVRLNWRLYPSQASLQPSLDPLFQRALKLPDGRKTLHRTDQALVTLINWATGRGNAPACRLFDVLLLDKAGIDWDEVLREGRELALEPYLFPVIRYLQDDWIIDFPDTSVWALARKLTWLEKLETKLLCAPSEATGIGKRLAVAMLYHRRLGGKRERTFYIELLRKLLQKLTAGMDFLKKQ